MRRCVILAMAAVIGLGAARSYSAEKPSGAAPQGGPGIEYLPLGAPAGMSEAVIVQGLPLVHTRQLFPVDKQGKIVGPGAVDQQIGQLLANLEAVLKDAGSGLDKLVRLNVYALSADTVTALREQLSKRLPAGVRPTITSILSPLAQPDALLALDAVAGAADAGKTVVRKRCDAVAGDKQCADAAVLPRGGVAYLSGQPDEAGITVSAVTRSMTNLMTTLRHMQLKPEQVVQVKIFLRPMPASADVLKEVQKFFPEQMTPPVVFVEWLAAVPIEIEMIAQAPLREKPAGNVRFFTPPEVRPSNTFSKAAFVQTPRQIYLSGIYASVPSRGEPQADDVFGQLQTLLNKTGSDLRHMVKATYYVCDDDAARWIDRTRPKVLDPDRPPAASKVMVHGMGQVQRTMTVDMIAVEVEK